MSTDCFAMVKGSSVRITALTNRGALPDDAITYVVSRAVASITINEVTESGGSEILRGDNDDPRLHFVKAEEVTRHKADISFLRVDPSILSMMTNVPVVTNYAGDVVGFDANTRLPSKAVGLEVWSKLAGAHCIGGAQTWGYTVFPFLRGGVLSGFSFGDGLVSFNVTGAQTRRGAKWNVGPWDITGAWQRLPTPVSRNTSWRTVKTTLAPPAQTNGTATFADAIDGGTAAVTSGDVIDGGTAAVTTAWIIDGGTS